MVVVVAVVAGRWVVRPANRSRGSVLLAAVLLAVWLAAVADMGPRKRGKKEVKVMNSLIDKRHALLPLSDLTSCCGGRQRHEGGEGVGGERVRGSRLHAREGRQSRGGGGDRRGAGRKLDRSSSPGQGGRSGAAFHHHVEHLLVIDGSLRQDIPTHSWQRNDNPKALTCDNVGAGSSFLGGGPRGGGGLKAAGAADGAVAEAVAVVVVAAGMVAAGLTATAGVAAGG